MEKRPLLTWKSLELELHNPFRIAHGTSSSRTALLLSLANGAGLGEASIPPYYGIPAAEMIAFWEQVNRWEKPLPNHVEEIADWVGIAGPAPARCALDLALHDRIGRFQQQPLHALLGLQKPTPLPTSFTIGIDTPEKMAEQARKIGRFSMIKLKLGSDDDVARLTAVRAACPNAQLCIDANAGWTVDEAIANIPRLAAHNLTFIEQPVAKDEINGMGDVQRHSPVPIVADESVQTMQDIEQLAAAGVQGINLKLMKVGGLAPALAMLRRANALGLRVLLGCMVETSLGVTAMAHLSGLADWLDLDAPLLIKNDPFEGVTYNEEGEVHLPDGFGIGVKQ